MAQLIDCELTDRVRNLPAREGDMREELSTKQIGGWGALLEQDWYEPSVEIAHATLSQKATETGHQPSCVASLRNHPDASGFQRRQEYVCEESELERHLASQRRDKIQDRDMRERYGLSDTRGAEVYRRAIPDRRVLVAGKGHELLFPKLITSEFASALDEIADGGGPKAGQEGRGSFFRDDETPTGEKAMARKSRIYLNACLDDINCCGTPGHGMSA